jgi:DNA polymerase-3 subunit delta
MADSPTVLLLHGSDEFAIRSHIDKLCASLGDPSAAEMNIAHFDGRSGLDQEAFNNAINAVPFLSPRRLVTLAHPGAVFGSPETRTKFIEQIEALPATTMLVLVEYEECKPAYWLMKWAGSAGGRAQVHVYNLPKRWEMPRWIESEAKKLGGAIEPAAAARLAEMVGEDPRQAAQEITKLLTYADYKRPLTVADVEAVSLVSAQGSVFELVDALGTGDGKNAQKTLHRLLEDEDPFALWGMVLRQFRLLLQAREILDERGGPLEVQKELGLHEFVAGKITNQARRFPLTRLEAIYHQLLEIDEGAKIGQVPLDLALDTLVVELTRK